jgi:hypothetical protein
MEWYRQFMEPKLSVEAVGTTRIGKCFHTGNMGFPLSGWIRKIRVGLEKRRKFGE